MIEIIKANANDIAVMVAIVVFFGYMVGLALFRYVKLQLKKKEDIELQKRIEKIHIENMKKINFIRKKDCGIKMITENDPNYDNFITESLYKGRW